MIGMLSLPCGNDGDNEGTRGSEPAPDANACPGVEAVVEVALIYTISRASHPPGVLRPPLYLPALLCGNCFHVDAACDCVFGAILPVMQKTSTH